MSTPSPLPLPDYDRLASSFDRFLPQIHPVALAILDHLPALAPDASVLDVACGTGEPGLTLARRSPSLRLLGVDRAEAMIGVARLKAEHESLSRARFEAMSSESLSVADASMDAVISRFGLLMFGDVAASARELGRVLRPGGHFSLAVWDGMERNTLVRTASALLHDAATPEQAAMVKTLGEWAREGRRASVLTEAGLGDVRSAMFEWSYTFDSFEGAWALVTAMGSLTGQAGLSSEREASFKTELELALSPHRTASGQLVIPHACRLFWGRR